MPCSSRVSTKLLMTVSPCVATVRKKPSATIAARIAYLSVRPKKRNEVVGSPAEK